MLYTHVNHHISLCVRSKSKCLDTRHLVKNMRVFHPMRICNGLWGLEIDTKLPLILCSNGIKSHV